MKTLVVYHADCSDGFCAAWLFHKAFPEAEFHAAHYGTEPPDVTGKEVYIVDFSYKRDVIQNMRLQAKSIVLLDHHKTVLEELESLMDPATESSILPGGCNLHITFDMEKSGGRLAWEYLYVQKLLSDNWLTENRFSFDKSPWLVDYTEDRDLWRWKLSMSREVNAALRSFPLEFAVWNCLSMRTVQQMGIEGEAILRYQQGIIDNHVRNARAIDMDGHKVLCVNATVLVSEIAGELAKGRPFGACCHFELDGKIQWSLRSDENGIDVSEIAKQHGGGGHQHAAGFEENLKELTLRLK